ncbi:OB-fold domain-containing protein [Xanthobacter dioxanivorans]|uniref:OB-fold domain-containing protein n=1 Tax=Xanthobacter dioxanivorans TaxID=2528964 RepID=A0A974PSE1_9HYPH|nr:OB-fold domain-containing protein [Xanthobacter dioxanivorans]
MNPDKSTLTFEQDPLAIAYPESREFWVAAEMGNLLLKTCDECGRAHWYPRTLCPLCGSERTQWKVGSGTGTIYAFSRSRRMDPPCTLAYVTLSEGPMLMTHIVDARAEDLKIGQAVSVQFRPTAEGRAMPFFSTV